MNIVRGVAKFLNSVNGQQTLVGIYATAEFWTENQGHSRAYLGMTKM